MRFMIGIIVAGVIVVTWNMFFLSMALDSPDSVVPSYETEAR